MPLLLPFNGHLPKIAPTAFVADNAVIIGDVEIGPHSNIWFGCVLRGDVNIIRIGARTNIQDGTVVHVSTGGQGTHIGDGVTVGHMALLHDCTVQSDAFVGMKACVLDKACIESGAMLAAGGLLTGGKRIPRGELWAGNPAKLLRSLSDKDQQMIKHSAERYCELAHSYQTGPRPGLLGKAASAGSTLSKLAQLRSKFPLAYAKWSAEDDRYLEELFRNHVPFKEIADLMGRKQGAIISRLKKRGLMAKEL